MCLKYKKKSWRHRRLQLVHQSPLSSPTSTLSDVAVDRIWGHVVGGCGCGCKGLRNISLHFGGKLGSRLCMPRLLG